MLASTRKRQKRIIKGCKVVATYLGHSRYWPVMFTGTVKNVTETRVMVYPDRTKESQRLKWAGRKDKDGRTYITISRSRALRID